LQEIKLNNGGEADLDVLTNLWRINMDSKSLINKLRLMASTIEELEIDDIISCTINSDAEMHVHLLDLKITPPDEATWTERFQLDYNWKKSFTQNNINFFSVHTEEEYKQEKTIIKE
jgi:hypothetical protein